MDYLKSMKTSLSILFGLLQVALFAQQYNSGLKDGNELYHEGKYDEAEVSYRKALESQPENDVKGAFNLGDALYKQERYEEATQQFAKVAATAEDKEIKSKAFHNLGNSLAQQKKYKEAIESYKNAMKLNPKDSETRYNLAKTMKQLQQQQQQQQKKNDEKIEPSEFAKQLKKRCDALVAQFQFAEAKKLMEDGLKKDQTVSYYNDFIKKLNDVVEIDQ